MYSKTELDKEISQIWILYTNSYEYYYCLRQVSKYERTEHTDSRFIYFLTYTSWYIIIIELCKLYQNDNKSQQYNIYGLINRLKNNYKKLEYNLLLTKSDIEKYYNDLNSPRIIDIRNRLIVLRDKFYAHTDRLDENFINKINISLDEVEILFNILRAFIFDIKEKVFSSHAVFEEDIFINLDKVLKNIDESKKREHDERIRLLIEEQNNLKRH